MLSGPSAPLARSERAWWEPVWWERVNGFYFGSPVWVDGRLYCIARNGDVVVLAAADDGTLPPMEAEKATGSVEVPPASVAFVVEPTFSGTWTVEKPVRKHFCIKLK